MGPMKLLHFSRQKFYVFLALISIFLFFIRTSSTKNHNEHSGNINYECLRTGFKLLDADFFNDTKVFYVNVGCSHCFIHFTGFFTTEVQCEMNVRS